MGKRKFRVTKQGVWVIGGVVALLLVMAGIGMLVWWLQNKDSLPTSGAGTITQTAETPVAAAANEAQKLAVSGNVEESNKKIQEALGQQNVPNEERQQLYVQQGVNYGNSGDYAKALQAYLEAEKSKSDFTTSHLIGEAYEALGDNAKAVEYFKKGISQLDQSAVSYNSDKEYYEGKVKELGGSL